MVTSFKRSHACTATLSVPNPAAGHCRPMPPWKQSYDLDPDSLEWEVKWALGSITMNKASGYDGIPVQLFQILKDDAVKVVHSICQQIWKTQQWPQDWKRSVFIPVSKKGNAKECSTTAQLHSSHTLAK